jgi:dihydropteroate synthase
MPHEWRLGDRVLTIGPRPLVMGIVNVTPDSFSDGGRYLDHEPAVAHALELVGQGADLLDVGGESTRPGAEPVPVEEELRRVRPVLEALTGRVATPVSVDTSKAAVAEACLAAGARIINDVTALQGDPEMARVARKTGAGVILMHMQGTPRTMQDRPHYDDVVREVGEFFDARLQAVTAAGIPRECVVLDPGIGFGKTRQHNLLLLARLETYQRFGRPVCLGLSRKGFIGRMLGDRPTQRRLAGSLGATCFALGRQAVQIVRVHDVEETRDAVTVFSTLEDLRAGAVAGSGDAPRTSSMLPDS